VAGPLVGVRVLDLSWILSGPFCTMVLADMGAEVVKVERPPGGDAARGIGPFVDGVSSYFLSLNRNKKSITLDLRRPEGKDLLLRLAARADVLVENFTPGTMERLGLGYATLSRVNPRLIYCAISGFGQDGPYAQRPALDIIVQAMGGVMSITGEPNGPPVRPGTSYGDIVAGLFAAIGICAALHERQQSGKGQYIDISMLDCQVAVLENALARYFATGEIPRPLGTRHPAATPFQAFPTKDGWIVVAIFGGNETHWPLFCAAIGHPEWIDDPRFQTSWSRTQHIDILEPAIAQAMRQKTTQEWLEELLPMGIPCGPVNTIDKVVEDPQVRHRRMLVELPHPRLGVWRYPNTPIRLSRTPGGVRANPPELGEHTREVLQEWLGLSPQEVDRLRREGVV
jgi:CoA:oxalate CoA-transferase